MQDAFLSWHKVLKTRHSCYDVPICMSVQINNQLKWQTVKWKNTSLNYPKLFPRQIFIAINSINNALHRIPCHSITIPVSWPIPTQYSCSQTLITPMSERRSGKMDKGNKRDDWGDKGGRKTDDREGDWVSLSDIRDWISAWVEGGHWQR